MHEKTCLISTTVFYASVYKLMAEVLPNGYLETFHLAGFPKKVKWKVHLAVQMCAAAQLYTELKDTKVLPTNHCPSPSDEQYLLPILMDPCSAALQDKQ